MDLKEKGIVCSENRVAKLMKSHQIAANRKTKFVITTDSKHDLPVAENKLNQDFTASKPNQKWVADITYVWTTEGWLYLAVVLERSAAAVIFSKSSRLVNECPYGNRTGHRRFEDGFTGS